MGFFSFGNTWRLIISNFGLGGMNKEKLCKKKLSLKKKYELLKREPPIYYYYYYYLGSCVPHNKDSFHKKNKLKRILFCLMLRRLCLFHLSEHFFKKKIDSKAKLSTNFSSKQKLKHDLLFKIVMKTKERLYFQPLYHVIIILYPLIFGCEGEMLILLFLSCIS
jgi:hypothetical protein